MNEFGTSVQELPPPPFTGAPEDGQKSKKPYVIGEYLFDPVSGKSFHLKHLTRLRVDPTSEDFELTSRNIAYFEGDHGMLMKMAEEALEADPEDISALIDKAIALSMKGDVEASLAINERVLALEPENAAALHNKGMDLIDLGKDKEALESFNKAIASDPSYIWSHVYHAEILERMGRRDDALDTYVKIFNMPGTGILGPYQHQEIAERFGCSTAAEALEKIAAMRKGQKPKNKSADSPEDPAPSL